MALFKKTRRRALPVTRFQWKMEGLFRLFGSFPLRMPLIEPFEWFHASAAFRAYFVWDYIICRGCFTFGADVMIVVSSSFFGECYQGDDPAYDQEITDRFIVSTLIPANFVTFGTCIWTKYGNDAEQKGCDGYAYGKIVIVVVFSH